jgi:hypothetical protein
MAYAKLDPLQRAEAGIYAGARGLASGIGRMLGGEDPGMRRVTEQDQIIRSIDLNNPETYGPAAQRALQTGHSELAQKIMNRYNELQESSALIGQRKAAAKQSLSVSEKNAAEMSDLFAQQQAYAALRGKAPIATQPVSTQPIATQPVSTQPIAAQPVTPTSITQNLLDRNGRPYSVDIKPVEMRSVFPRISEIGADLLPAAPIAQAALAPTSQTRLALNQQISELEKRRLQLLSLPKVPAAKAEADVLGDQIKELRDQGKPTDLSKLESEIEQLRDAGATNTDPRIKARQDKIIKLSSSGADRFGVDREAISMTDFGKTFAQLTQAERKLVNKQVDEKEATRTPKVEVKNIIPGQPVAPRDWMDFTQKVLSNDPVMQRTSTIISDAPSAIEIIRSSTTNDISAASLPGALARLTGEGKSMSNQDVQRFARTGGLDDRLAQDVVKFFSGTTTNVKKDQAEKFATALYRGALIERRKKLVDEAEQYGYLDSPNYKSALRQIDDKLSRFQLKTKGGSDTPVASGADAEKEARYQAYKRAQKGK